MASRKELRLQGSVLIRDDQIIFEKVDRDVPPKWAWIQLATAETDIELARAAGLFGAVSMDGRDNLETWRGLRTHARLMLASITISELDLSTLSDSVITRVMGLAADEGMTPETELRNLRELVNDQVRAGWIEISRLKPFTVCQASSAGAVHTQAINELLQARHLLECKQCSRLFLHNSKRPTSFCSTACRKAHSINNPQGGDNDKS